LTFVEIGDSISVIQIKGLLQHNS